MRHRRDVLFGLGAAILAGSFAPLGLAKRERGEDPRYAFGQIGPSIEGLPIDGQPPGAGGEGAAVAAPARAS